MMSFFNRNWAGAYGGSLDWTKTAGWLNWRMSDRLGWSVFGLLGRSWADTGLVCRPCVVEPGVGLLLLLIGRLWMWHSSARRTRRKKGRPSNPNTLQPRRSGILQFSLPTVLVQSNDPPHAPAQFRLKKGIISWRRLWEQQFLHKNN